MISFELAGHDLGQARDIERGYLAGRGEDWHLQWSKPGMRGPAGWIDAPQPSSHAAIVLSAVGCDWREPLISS